MAFGKFRFLVCCLLTAFVYVSSANAVVYQFSGVFSSGPRSGENVQGTLEYNPEGNGNFQSGIETSLSITGGGSPVIHGARSGAMGIFQATPQTDVTFESSGYPFWTGAITYDSRPSNPLHRRLMPVSSVSVSYVENAGVSTAVVTIAIQGTQIRDFNDLSDGMATDEGLYIYDSQWIADTGGCGGCTSTILFSGNSGDPLEATIEFTEPVFVISFDLSEHSFLGGEVTISTDKGEEKTVETDYGTCLGVVTGFDQLVEVLTIETNIGWNTGIDNINIVPAN